MRGRRIINICKTEDLNIATESPTIWIIGDSTVSAFSDIYYYPRYGWGTQISCYLDDKFVIKNLALSGRSSKSYLLDTEYTTLINSIKSGDFLFIGFGHNDEKTEPERYTNPNGTYKDCGTFVNSLYENYIKIARSKNVKVILFTPIVRRSPSGEWANQNLHITTNVAEYAGGDYSKAIISLGNDLNIPVVDMTSLTKDLYDKLGAAETLYLHAWTSSNEASVDNTHTNIWGSMYNAYLITKAIKALNISGLSEHIIIADAPTKVGSLLPNPNYKKQEYTSNLPNSLLWQSTGIWQGSVFGDLCGALLKENFILEDANDKIHIAVKNDNGKVASTAEGIAMYYCKVPSSSTFTLTATATINRITLNDQVSFGLMARDDMYIDKNIIDTMGDYVAAGILKLTQQGNVWNCFARKSGVLTNGGICANTYKAGDTVSLKIQSNSDGYSCTFGSEQAITAGFDFKLTSIDPDNIYVGMYVARNADITFSNIRLVVHGASITK